MTDDTLAHLMAIPDLALEALETKGAPNPTPRTEEARPGKPGSKPPVDLAYVDAFRADPDGKGHSLRGVLALAVRAVREDARQHGAPVPELTDEPTWAGDCDWLARTVGYWSGDPWLRQYVTESVAAIHRELERMCRVPPPLDLRCTQCSAQYRERVHYDPMRQRFYCEAGHEIDHAAEVTRLGRLAVVEAERKEAEERRRKPVTVRQAAKELGIPEKTLYRWASAGVVRQVGGGERDRTYRLSDFRRAAQVIRTDERMGA